MNYKGVYRTSPATPGLLTTLMIISSLDWQDAIYGTGRSGKQKLGRTRISAVFWQHSAVSGKSSLTGYFSIWDHTAKIGRNVYITPNYEIFWNAICDILYLLLYNISLKYNLSCFLGKCAQIARKSKFRSNSAFWTYIGIKVLCRNIILIFFQNLWWKPNGAVVHTFWMIF